MSRSLRPGALAVALAAGLALAIPEPAPAQFLPYYGKNKVAWDTLDWQVYRSPHFDVHYYQGMERELERLVELLERSYRDISAALDHPIRFRIPVLAYRTHSEFEQTHVLDFTIDESIAAFAEPALNRMVLPADGTDEELGRLVAHELTHIFEFSMVYRGLRPQVLIRRPPQWAFEGFADFMSHDVDPLERMVLRDAVLHDRIPKMSAIGDGAGLASPLLVYKLGQAAFEAIEERFGMNGVRRLWWGFRKDTLLGGTSPWKTAFDLDDQELDRLVERYLRRTYPVAEGRDRPWTYERRLELGGDLDQVVALAPSPSGEVLAVLASNRRTGELDLGLVSARDGALLRNLTPGTTTRWDYLTLDGRIAEGRSIAWDAGGTRVAVFARSGKRRSLLLYDAASGALAGRFPMTCEQAAAPSFTADGSGLVFSGTLDVGSELLRLDLASGATRRLDADPAAGPAFDRTPAVDPDGTAVVYVTRVGGRDHLARRPLAGGPRVLLTAGDGNDSAPWFDPRGNLYYLSDRGGAFDVWRIARGAGAAERLTEVVGGNFSPVALGPSGEIAFVSYFDGRFEAYVESSPAPRETLALAPPEAGGDAAAPSGFAALDPLLGGRRPGRRLFLTGISQIQAGITSDGTFFGETTAEFEDLLANRSLVLSARTVREFQSVYGAFVNRARRLEWVLEGYDLSTFFFADPLLATIDGRPGGEAKVRDRVSGGGLSGRYAFSRYRRARFGVNLERRDRAFTRDDIGTSLLSDGTALRLSAALVEETTRFRAFGPLSGRTWRLAATWAPPVDDWLSFASVEGDLRQYLQLSRASLAAFRVFGFYSGGGDPQFLAFGGGNEFRGADYNAFSGTRGFYANAELRFPLVDLVRTPVLSLSGIRGTIFFDLAAAGREGDAFRFTAGGDFRLEDARAAFGGGLVFGLLGLPLHLDGSWPTDLASVGSPQVSVWLGFDY